MASQVVIPQPWYFGFIRSYRMPVDSYSVHRGKQLFGLAGGLRSFGEVLQGGVGGADPVRRVGECEGGN